MSQSLKYSILSVLLILVFSGCAEDNKAKLTSLYGNELMEMPYLVIRVDGCEYISAYNRLAHKGNCDNPIHLYRLEKENTILMKTNTVIAVPLNGSITQLVCCAGWTNKIRIEYYDFPEGSPEAKYVFPDGRKSNIWNVEPVKP